MLQPPGTASKLAATSCTVTNLTPGTPYDVVVTATNIAGTGPASPLATFTPAGTPDAPVLPTVVAGDRQATLEWSPPTNNGGSPVLDYLVVASPGGSSCTAVGADARGCAVPNLTNDATYTLTVKARNMYGYSSPSSPLSVTPHFTIKPPSPPPMITAQPGVKQFLLMWSPPQDNGGDPDVSYTVTSIPAGLSCRTEWQTYCTIPNVTPGRLYAFYVTATNSAGTSGKSQPTFMNAAHDYPPVPANVNVAPAESSLTITWAPVSLPTVLGIYAHQYSIDDGMSWSDPVPVDTTNTYTLRNLTNEKPYKVRVRAMNNAGLVSPPTATFTATPSLTHSAPARALFIPTPPTRVYDSRVADGKMVNNITRTLPLTTPTTPHNAVAVAYNLTVTDTNRSGWIAVTPSTTTGVPTTSTINWDTTATTLANAHIVGVPLNNPTAKFTIGGGGSAHMIVDVIGYYVAPTSTDSAKGLKYVPITPSRAYDSRDTLAPLTPGTVRNVALPGLPPQATAVTYTLTATDTTASGWVAVTPSGTAQTGSTLNWSAPGTTIANSAHTAINGKTVALHTSNTGGSVHTIIDITGYFIPMSDTAAGLTFTPITPTRIHDSRTTNTPLTAGKFVTLSLPDKKFPPHREKYCLQPYCHGNDTRRVGGRCPRHHTAPHLHH